jgi:phosphoglycerate dehydrogenase-like enzyme
VVIHVALVGSFLSEAEPILAEEVTEPAEFHPIPDSADDSEVASVLSRADVVVGDWPDVDAASEARLVQQVGAGVDNYDRAALPRTAYLCNVYGHDRGVAEHVFALLLALRRRLPTLDADLRRGQWPEPDVGGAVGELRGLTMGIVGYGRIGREVTGLARAFDVDVLATRSSPPEGPPPEGVAFLGGPDDLDRVLRESDVAVLSLPLTDETEGLVGAAELDALGPDGYLINVARGPVVEERALYEALDSGTIAGAGIDTWYRYPDDRSEPCPPSAYPFDELDNVVMTPHVAGWTGATARHRWQFVAANVDRIARGERPENVVREPRDG